jgi:hypothetical protein
MADEPQNTPQKLPVGSENPQPQTAAPSLTPPPIQRNAGAYADVVIEQTPKRKSDILLDESSMKIKVYCSCGQPFEISFAAAGQPFNCPSCKRELTIPQMVQNKTNQRANAESQKLFIRFRKFSEILKSQGDMTLWLLGVAVTIIAGMWLTLVLMAK